MQNDRASIESIYRILSLIGRVKNKKPSRTKTIETIMFFMAFFLVIVAIVSAFLYSLTHHPSLYYFSSILLILGYIVYIAIPIVVIGMNLPSIRDFIANPFRSYINDSKKFMIEDFEYARLIARKDKSVIESVSIELNKEKNAMETRSGVFIGAIHKIGILPGIFAIMVNVSKYWSSDGATTFDWVSAIAYANLAMAVFSLIVYDCIMKLDRAINIVDMAIKLKDQISPANES